MNPIRKLCGKAHDRLYKGRRFRAIYIGETETVQGVPIRSWLTYTLSYEGRSLDGCIWFAVFDRRARTPIQRLTGLKGVALIPYRSKEWFLECWLPVTDPFGDVQRF